MGALLYFLVPQNIFIALVIASVVYGVTLVGAGALGPDEWLIVGKLMPKRLEGLILWWARKRAS